nr:U-box domain-containing protein 5 [Ipomoea batatas]
MPSENNCIIEDVDNEVNFLNPYDFNDSDSFDSSDDDDENCVDTCENNSFNSNDNDGLESFTFDDNSLLNEHVGELHDMLCNVDDELNVDASLLDLNDIEFDTFHNNCLDDAIYIHDLLGEEKEGTDGDLRDVLLSSEKEEEKALTCDVILARCKKSMKLLERSLGEMQHMVPVMLAAEISQLVADLRGAKFRLDPSEEEAEKIVKELLHHYASTSCLAGERAPDLGNSRCDILSSGRESTRFGEFAMLFGISCPPDRPPYLAVGHRLIPPSSPSITAKTPLPGTCTNFTIQPEDVAATQHHGH